VLQVGWETEPRRSWLASGLTAPAIAGALVVAAVVAVAGVVAQTGFVDTSFGDRVTIAVVSSISAMGLVLAATVSLRWSGQVSDELARRPRLRGLAYDAMGVIAVAIAASSCWAFVDAFVRDVGGEGVPHLVLQRFGLASASLAPLFLAIAVLAVIAGFRRRAGLPDVRDQADPPDPDVFADGLIGPTIGCLLGAGLVSVALAVNEAFTANGASFWDRVALVSVPAGDVTTAFLAFAVVVLVVLGYRDRARSGAALRLAGFIGGFVTVGAAYALYRLATTSSHSSPGLLFLGTFNWWIRVARIAAALAALVVGGVVVGIARQLLVPRRAVELPSWAPPQPDHELQPRSIVTVSRTGARTVAAMLGGSTAAYAAFAVLTVAGGYEIAVNEAIAQIAPFVLIIAGLALAAALVMSASRPDVTGRDTLNDVFDGVVGLIAVAAFAVSAYSIFFVLFGRHTGRLSALAHVGTAQRLQYVGTSIAAVLVAAAAIHLIVRGRQQFSAPGEETEDEVEALDLLS
jgi:hypothetical protein